MPYTIKDIARALDAEAFGDLSITVTTVSEPDTAGPNDLALAMSVAYTEKLSRGRARAAVIPSGCDWQALGLEAAIFAPRARLAMARLTQTLDEPLLADTGIHPSAVVEGDLAEGVTIGPFSFIAAGAQIGPGTRIGAHVTVNAGAKIGAHCMILDGVRIMRRVQIGDRVIVHPNAVIGADGFSYVTENVSNFELALKSMGKAPIDPTRDARQHRIHSLGGVHIADDVEIGACTTVDAGTIRPTRIGARVKLDNHCQIAHNAVIGEDCVMAAFASVAGSTVIGDRVIMGGDVKVADNLFVGNDCVLTGATKVASNVPAGRVMMGYPATPMDVQVEIYKALRRLPRLVKDFQQRNKADRNSE